MKTITTIQGHEVNILSATMTRAHGYGQYTLNVQFSWNGVNFMQNIHSTDSKLFDDMRDSEDNTDFLCERAKNIIVSTAEDLISEHLVNNEQ